MQPGKKTLPLLSLSSGATRRLVAVQASMRGTVPAAMEVHGSTRLQRQVSLSLVYTSMKLNALHSPFPGFLASVKLGVRLVGGTSFERAKNLSQE